MKNKLYLSKDIYAEETINAAAKSFSHLAVIRKKDSQKYMVVSFRFCRYGVERTMKEFENYLIDLTNSNL